MSSRRSAKSKSSSSRSNNASNDLSKKNIAADSAPPNHPQENLPEHRTFLARSLSRNDEDLAALVDLNASLAKVRQNIIDACGEELLLDLGEGLFQLTPCGRDLMVALPDNPEELAQDYADNNISSNPTKQRRKLLAERLASDIGDEAKLLCVDFLLRMKLRRRLLNRLARRLMRVAHAMDGEDVSPPLPPKYGDLRLNIDPTDFEHVKRQWQLQEEARQRVDQFRQEHPDSLLPLVKVAVQTKNSNNDDDENNADGNEMEDEEKSTKSIGSDDEDDDDEEEDDEDDDEEVSQDNKGGDDELSDDDEDKSKSDEKSAEDSHESEESGVDSEAEKSGAAKNNTNIFEAKESATITSKDEVEPSKEAKVVKTEDSSAAVEPVEDKAKANDETKDDSAAKETDDGDVEMADVGAKEPKLRDAATKIKEENSDSMDVIMEDADTDKPESPAVSAELTSDSDSDLFAADDDDADSSTSKEKDTTTVKKKEASTEEEKVQDNNKAPEAVKKVEASKSVPTDASDGQTEGTAPDTTTGVGIDKNTDTPSKQEIGKTGLASTSQPSEASEASKDTPVVSSPSKVSAAAAEALLAMVSSPEPRSPEKAEPDVETPRPTAVKEEEKCPSEVDEHANKLKTEEKNLNDATQATNKEKQHPSGEPATDNATACKQETDESKERLSDKMDVEEIAAKDAASKEDTTNESLKVAEESIMVADSSSNSKIEGDSMNVDEPKQKPAESEPSGRKEGVDPGPPVKSEPEESACRKVEATTGGPGKGPEATQAGPKPDGAKSTPIKAAPPGEKTPNTSPEKEASMAGTRTRKKAIIELPPPRELSQLEKDYEILKDFVDAYEKEIDPITGQVTFRVFNSVDHEEDYTKITRGVGIGASNRASMSLKEKEVEFTRWQTSILSRMPEAPTFDQIGMQNCVFLLEERRKRLRAQREEKEKQANKKRKHSNDDEDYKPAAAKPERNLGAVERKSPTKKRKEEKDGAPVTKRMKPLPLVPYPSFHASDLRRVRLVHFDLITVSIQTGAKDRLETATNEYNAAFRNSTQLFERKTKLEQQLAQINSHYRAHFSKLKKQYDVDVAVKRNRWQNQKAQYDANRIKKLMPTSWNTMPMGTELTRAVLRKYRDGTIPHVVGTCVADIIDAVEIKLTNSQVQDEPFEDFKPPTPPDFNTVVVDQSTGETMSQQIARTQAKFQQEIQALTLKLNAAEEERKRAWKKLLKSRAEVEQGTGGHHGSQAPSLHSGQQAVASAGSRQHQMPSFTPGRRDSNRAIENYAPSGGVNTSDSKYSASRVRDRIGDDGTVEPISKKIGSDGLYQRPAGRGRKGMDWDAVRGVWVPQPPSPSS